MQRIRLLDGFGAYLTNWERRDKVSHYASNSGACVRKMYWDWRGEKKSNPPDAGAVLKMRFGNAAELIFEKYLDSLVSTESFINEYAVKSCDKQVKWKVPVEGLQYPVACVLDFVLELVCDRGTIQLGIELKSMYGAGIAYIQRTGEPKPDYLGQIKIYTTLTPIKVFSHPYLGRDNGYMTEFLLRDHPAGLESDAGRVYAITTDTVFDKFRTVEEHLNSGILPERDYLVAIKDGQIRDEFQKDKIKYKSDWQCGYCDYRDLCWKEECNTYRNSSNVDMFQSRK